MERVPASYRRSRFFRKAAPYIFISPFYINFLIFGAFPIIYALFLSFHSWNGIAGSPMRYIGWENYQYTLTDPIFWRSIWNTFILNVASSLPQHMLGLFFAFILNLGFVKFKEFFKATLFLPYITAGVGVAIIFGMIFGNRYGVLNYVFMNLPGFESIFNLFGMTLPWNWLGKSATIIPAISTLIIWQWTGWNTILYLAGLQAIPIELYEAARVDGAKWHQVFFKITLPSLKPMLQFAISMSIIGGMQIFTEPFILVGKDGGTLRAGYTAAMNIYQTGFEWNFFGSAAATSYLLFVIIFIMYFLNRRLIRSDEGVV